MRTSIQKIGYLSSILLAGTITGCASPNPHPTPKEIIIEKPQVPCPSTEPKPQTKKGLENEVYQLPDKQLDVSILQSSEIEVKLGIKNPVQIFQKTYVVTENNLPGEDEAPFVLREIDNIDRMKLKANGTLELNKDYQIPSVLRNQEGKPVSTIEFKAPVKYCNNKIEYKDPNKIKIILGEGDKKREIEYFNFETKDHQTIILAKVEGANRSFPAEGKMIIESQEVLYLKNICVENYNERKPAQRLNKPVQNQELEFLNFR